MKVAFVSTILGYPWGGADTLWTRAAEAAALRGDIVQIYVSALTRGHPRIEALERAGAKIVVRAQPTSGNLLQRGLRRAIGGMPRTDPVGDSLTKFHPDLVVVSCGGTYDLLLEAGIRRWLEVSPTSRLRVIANYQVENPALSESDLNAMRAAFRRAERIFFVSQRNLKTTCRHLLLSLPNAVVVHNPLRCGTNDSLPWPSSPPFRFATVGRLEEGKGLDLALHAVVAAIGAERDWELDIFGAGRLDSYLREIIAHYGIESRVRLRGHVATLKAIWSDHHLLLSPSVEDGVPMTIPEAMLTGRPVVATAVGAAEEWIKHGSNGYLCPAATLPLLAETIAAAWNDRSRWAELGQQATRDAAANYRPNDYQQLINV